MLDHEGHTLLGKEPRFKMPDESIKDWPDVTFEARGVTEAVYHTHIYIYGYGLVFRVPTPPNGMGPQVAPPSLLFASYWQHGPASYLLGVCSDSDYQPRIYEVHLPVRRPT